MRRDGTPIGRTALTMLALACALAAFAGAAGAASAMPAMTGERVDVLYQGFNPGDVTALVGDRVTWSNSSLRTHTVTADDGGFDSGNLTPGGTFVHTFGDAGVYTYHCVIHPNMVGRIDVSRVLLDPVTHPVAPNVPLVLTGRAALPAGSTVTIEADGAPIGSAKVAPDGSFSTTVKPAHSATFRAVPAGDAATTDASPAQQVLVVDHHVTARTERQGRRRFVVATVAPASPGSIVVLQMNLRRHFGWWPVAQARLDKHSQARFALPAGSSAPTRVVLTLRDGVTPLATSTTLRVARVAKHRGRARAHARHHHR